MNITDANFENEVINSPEPIMVKFWAVWCGPCKALAQTLSKMENKIKIVECDVDSNEANDLLAKFRIRGIPTMLFFKNGKHVAELIGNQPQETIKETIDRLQNAN